MYLKGICIAGLRKMKLSVLNIWKRHGRLRNETGQSFYYSKLKLLCFIFAPKYSLIDSTKKACKSMKKDSQRHHENKKLVGFVF